MHSDLSTHAATATSDRALAGHLAAAGILRNDNLRQALSTQQALGGRLDTVLLDMGLLTESALLETLGKFHSTRTVSAHELAVVSPSVARMISPRMAIRLEIVPFRLEGRTLSVATLNPGDLLVEDELRLLTDCRVASYVALEVRLYEALRRLYGLKLPTQISSVLARLNGEVKPTVERERMPQPAPQPPPAPAPPDRPEDDKPKKMSDYDTADVPELQKPKESVALEISEEDLELFPSLRGRISAGRATSLRLHDKPAGEPMPANPEDRMLVASEALQDAEMREDIADALLGYCAPILRRRLLLAVRDATVIGWRGEGEGIEPSVIRGISIPLTEPSVFVGLVQGAEFWLGPLPGLTGNERLVHAFGGEPPTECVIFPLIVRGKTVCFLYGDNVDESVAGLPISHLRRLVAKASLAFQVYLLKSKIRNL
jgi:hypothetical protein